MIKAREAETMLQKMSSAEGLPVTTSPRMQSRVLKMKRGRDTEARGDKCNLKAVGILNKRYRARDYKQ